MMYRHLNTGAVAELIEKLYTTLKLMVFAPGYIKVGGVASFMRWWKPVMY